MGATSSKQKARSTLKYDLADRPSPPGKPQLVQQETYPSEPDVVTIRWDPPLYDGGSKLIGYLVEHRRTGSPHWVRASPVLVNQPELTLSGLEPGWRYQFRISAKNAVGLSDPGELSDLLTVTLQRTAASPPCFVKELKDSAALENDKIELKVDVSGTPGPRISWYKDGLEVFSSRRHRISTENGTSTLIIHQAALGDEGEIKCTATNRVGHATTRATLRLEAPPSIRLPRQYEEGLLFEKGEVIRLKVLVAGRPEPDVMWYHNGETVYSGGRYEISHAEKYALLRIQEARRADRGEYHVKGVNKLGEDIASFLVTVTDRPMCPGRAKVVMTMGRSVTLSWTAPDDDGGCKIGNFIVEYYRIGWNMWLKAATCRQLTTTLDDLIEGSEYKFRVKAENPYGVSEPSEESDVVFIPDPKRGLLEPPERGRNNEDDMDIWLENNKRHPSSWLEKPVYNDSDSTTKNKVGKTWSEKNNIHHRETEIKEHILKAKNDLNNEDELNTEKNKPIIPKRKAKTGDKTKNLNQERTFRDKSSHYVEKSGEEENQLRSAKDEELNYGSSEMMLVLLPNSRAQTEERESSNREEFVRHFEEDRSEVAPPMSLSAPELGSGEPIFPPLRGCVSSSELLHELAMTRVYQDLAQYETEKGLKRKHSFDQRKTADCRSITDTDVPEGNLLNHAKDNLSEKFLNQTYEEDNFKIKRIKNTSNEETTGVLKVKQERERPYSTNTYLSNDNKDDSGQYSLQNKLQNLKEYVIDGGRILKKETIDKDEQEEEDGEDRDEEVLDEEEQEEEMEEEEEEEEEEDEEDDEEEVDVQEDEEMAYEKLSDNELDLEETEDKMLKGNLDIIKIGKENSYTTDVWRRDYNEDEETYHPRSMVPMPATAPRLKVQEQETNKSKIKPATDTSLKGDVLKRSNQKDYKQPSVISHISNIKTKEPVNEQKYKMLEKIADNSQNLQTDKEKEKEEMSPHNIENQQSGAGRRYTPSRSPVTLKPILKHRDHSQERTDESKEKRETFVAPIANVEPDLNIVLDSNIELDETEDFLKLRKKQVRIEEPYRNTSISINDTSELVSSRSLSEETDPTKIVINHYSDIVAEFGKGKKTSHSLYLSYDELKAAAITVEEPPEMAFEATERGTNDDVTSQSTSGSFESTSSSQTEDVTDITESEKLVKESSESASAPIVLSYTERKVRWLVDYLTDLAMFLVACWLYACKDERLAIPVLILMAYRQVHEIIMSKIPQRWRRKRL